MILGLSKIIGRRNEKLQKLRNRSEPIVGSTRIWKKTETSQNNQVRYSLFEKMHLDYLVCKVCLVYLLYLFW